MARDWEQCYRQGETPWDKGMAAPPLEEMIGRVGLEVFRHGPVLVPGSGLGHDVRAIAAHGLEVIGLDLSETAVARANRIPPVGRERHVAGDFLDPAWPAGRRFGAIWEHTCFCAIDPSLRDAYARACAAVLDEGGILCGVFYLTPHDPGEEHEGPPFETSVEELERRFSPWFSKVDGWVPAAAYPGREGREWIGIFRRLPHAPVAG